MNMRLLTMVFFLMLSAMSFANDKKGTVTGKVQDAAGKEIPYASIEIYTKGETQSLVSGGMSEENGTFVIEGIDYGTYELVITAVGFNDKVQDINVQSPTIDLGAIVMGSDVVVLEGAEIRAETSQYRTEIDKRVVDVGKDLVSAGADAASVLNNIPSVSVDQQTGALSLRGNENVKVMVDGKPSNIPAAQLLKQLPSNAIAKVEIITNPSAKYDPEGNSGIINIITHKNKRKGYNVGLDLGYTLGDNSRHNGSVNANVNTGSFNFFGNYNANLGEHRNHGRVRNYVTGLDQFFDINDENNSQLFKVGFDWFIGEKTALTLYTSQLYNHGDGDGTSNIFDNNTNTFYENINDVYGEYNNQDYSLNFKQDFGKDDHNIVLDAIYSTSDNKDNRGYFYDFPEGDFHEWRKGENNNTRINLDYTNQIIDGGKIETGIQFRQENSANSMTSDQTLWTGGDNPIEFIPFVDFDFTRDIYSAYVNYGQTFGKFGVQLGLRAEMVEENADFYAEPNGAGIYKNSYEEFYPSAFLTYDVTEKGQLLLNYSRRVDRPGVNQLTPVPEWSTPTMISEGNPELRPQFTDSYELGYLQKFKGGSINATAFYRRVNDLLFRYLEQGDSITTIQRYTNYDKSESYGMEISANYKPTKWWSFNTSFDIFANKFYLDNEEVTGTPHNFRINNNFNLTKALSVQNFFMYRGAFKFIQGEMQPMWRMDLGARYSFMDGKASLTARVSDIFKTFHAEARVNNPMPGVANFNWESQTLYVGFSYNFGGEVRKRNLNQESNSSGQGGGIGF